MRSARPRSAKASGESVGIAAADGRSAVLELLPGFVSGLLLVTVAVFETMLAVTGNVTTSVIVAEPPGESVPMLQVTVEVPAQLP